MGRRRCGPDSNSEFSPSLRSHKSGQHGKQGRRNELKVAARRDDIELFETAEHTTKPSLLRRDRPGTKVAHEKDGGEVAARSTPAMYGGRPGVDRAATEVGPHGSNARKECLEGALGSRPSAEIQLERVSGGESGNVIRSADG